MGSRLRLVIVAGSARAVEEAGEEAGLRTTKMRCWNSL